MKCQVCQADLSPGSTFCTNCGTPVPSNPYGSPVSGSSPNQGIPPTMLASSAPQPDPYGTPSSPYGTPQPQANPYGTPSSPYGGVPSTGYGADAGIPPAPNPYGAPAAPYGTPPPPAYNPNAGTFGVPGSYGQPQYVPQQPKKKGPNGCVIAAIIVISLFVLIVGGIITAVAVAANKVSQTYTSTVSSINATATADMATANALLSPTTGTGSGATGGVPSASQVDSNAKTNIFNVQTANQVDSNYKPTNVTSNFSTSDTVYITYDHSSTAGYIIEKTYDSTGAVAVQSGSPHPVASDIANGEIELTNLPADSYTTGVYWCVQSDCSDAALASVVTFTVS